MEKKYREVKRVAKVGEKVKITNTVMCSGKYKIGDVLTVTVTEHDGVRADNSIPLFHSEYVVLEPIEESNQEFTLADLKPGIHVVKLRENVNGFGILMAGRILFENKYGELENFNNDLTSKYSNKNDIVEVFEIKNNFYLPSNILDILNKKYLDSIWKRIEKTPTQLKLEELETKQRAIADEIAEIRKGL